MFINDKSNMFSFGKSLLFVLLIMVINGCDFFCVAEDDSIISEDRNLPEYSIINVIEKDTRILLTQGSSQGCVISGTNSILKNLLLNVKNKELIIEMFECESNHKIINMDLNIETLTGISSGANSEITATGLINADILELDMIDDGEITIEDLFAEKIIVNVQGSGNINLGGDKNVSELIINISGCGNVNAYNLPADKIKVNISGSGSCRINPISILDVRISGSGNVYYSGEPIINSNISGSGEVIKL